MVGFINEDQLNYYQSFISRRVNNMTNVIQVPTTLIDPVAQQTPFMF
jgi:hypothetical protein